MESTESSDGILKKNNEKEKMDIGQSRNGEDTVSLKEEEMEKEALKILLSRQKGVPVDDGEKNKDLTMFDEVEAEQWRLDALNYGRMPHSFQAVKYLGSELLEMSDKIQSKDYGVGDGALCFETVETGQRLNNTELNGSTVTCVNGVFEEEGKIENKEGHMYKLTTKKLSNDNCSDKVESTEVHVESSTKNDCVGSNGNKDTLTIVAEKTVSSIKRKRVRQKDMDTGNECKKYLTRSTTRNNDDVVFCKYEPKKRQRRKSVCQLVVNKGLESDLSVLSEGNPSKRKSEDEDVGGQTKRLKKDSIRTSECTRNFKDKGKEVLTDGKIEVNKVTGSCEKREHGQTGNCAESSNYSSIKMTDSDEKVACEGNVQVSKAIDLHKEGDHNKSENVECTTSSLGTNLNNSGPEVSNKDKMNVCTGELLDKKDHSRQNENFPGTSCLDKKLLESRKENDAQEVSSEAKSDSRLRRKLVFESDCQCCKESTMQKRKLIHETAYYQRLLAKVRNEENQLAKYSHARTQVSMSQVKNPVGDYRQYMSGDENETDSETETAYSGEDSEETYNFGWGEFSLYVFYFCMFIVLGCFILYLYETYGIEEMSKVFKNAFVFLNDIG